MGMWSGFIIGYIIALVSMYYSKLVSRYIHRSANPLRTALIVIGLTIVWGFLLGCSLAYVVHNVGICYEQIA